MYAVIERVDNVMLRLGELDPEPQKGAAAAE
jgi:hypothetical protein